MLTIKRNGKLFEIINQHGQTVETHGDFKEARIKLVKLQGTNDKALLRLVENDLFYDEEIDDE